MSANDEDQFKVQPQDFATNPSKKKHIKGGCGDVQFVIQKSTEKHCVLKQTNLKNFDKLFKQEVGTLSKFHHPAIIEFIGFAVDGKKGNIYLKEAENGSLESCFSKKKVEIQNGSYKDDFKPLWDDTHKLIIAYGVARAMEYLHSQNILHRDLKADNILIDSDLLPYVTDFGTSKLADDIKSSQTIRQTTAKIMPPEFLEDYEKYNRSKPIDVYSYAMVLYRLWTELQIFPNLSELKIVQAILNKVRPEFPKGNYPGDNWKKLIEECWDQDPEKRPTFLDICKRLESPEFVTPNIDVELFEKYKQKCQINQESQPKAENPPDSNQDIKNVSIPEVLSDNHQKISTNSVDQYRTQIKNFDVNPSKRKHITGGCGEIHFVIQKSTGKHCVLKTSSLKKYVNLFKQEVEALSQFHHPAIIEFIGFAVDSKKGYIYLKEAENGSLESCISKRKIEIQNGSYKDDFKPLWDDTRKLIISYGVARAMEYFHSQKALHRDLKADNILIDSDLLPYVTDFGTSKLVDDIKSSQTIRQTTAKIMPPEFLENYEKFNRSLPIDVYSYAMVIYRLWTELQIFPKYTDVKIFKAILNKERPEIPNGNYPGDNWKKLIEECWDQDPEKRPTFLDICKRLESPEFVTPNIDVELFEKYKQKIQTNLESQSKAENPPDIKLGSIPKMLSYAKRCEEDSKLGSPEIFYEVAANYCHCLDNQNFFFIEDYKVYKCEDCDVTICEGCAKTCHKGHKIVAEERPEIVFACECGKNHFVDKRGKDHCSIEFVGQTKLGDAPACYQHFYKCKDCNNVSDGKLICQACKDQCHKDHNVEDWGVMRGYCSCGAHELDNGGKCKSSYYTNSEPGVCTCSKSNYPSQQRWFQCVTCGMVSSDDKGICKSCAEECHKGHVLLDRGVKRNKCQCQTTNACKLIK